MTYYKFKRCEKDKKIIQFYLNRISDIIHESHDDDMLFDVIGAKNVTEGLLDYLRKLEDPNYGDDKKSNMQKRYDQDVEDVIDTLYGSWTDKLYGESKQWKDGYRHGIAEGLSLVIRRFGKYSSDEERRKKAIEIDKLLFADRNNNKNDKENEKKK